MRREGGREGRGRREGGREGVEGTVNIDTQQQQYMCSRASVGPPVSVYQQCVHRWSQIPAVCTHTPFTPPLQVLTHTGHGWCCIVMRTMVGVLWGNINIW